MKYIKLVTVLIALVLGSIFLNLREDPQQKSTLQKRSARPIIVDTPNAAGALIQTQTVSFADTSIQTTRDSLHLETAKLYDFSKSTEEVQAEILQRAKSMTSSQILHYESVGLDENADPDERLAATYMLSVLGERGQGSLIKILTAPSIAPGTGGSAHSTQESHQKFEFSLRLMALEALEKNFFSSHGKLKISSTTLSQVADPRLSGLLKLVVAGQKSQKPLLKYFIDQQIEKVEI